MDIKVTIQPNGEWTAFDADTYDVDCDVNGFFSTCPMGYGKTREAAIGDLIDQIIEKLKDRNDADRRHLADLSDLQKRSEDTGAANAGGLQEVSVSNERSAGQAPDREPVGMAIASIVRALDDIVVLAANPATRGEVATEEEALWRAKGHLEWILSGIKEKQKDQPHIRAVK